MRSTTVVVAALVLATGFVSWARRPDLPAAERGRRIAERTGCFGCHGPGGLRGAQNPGRTDKSVPNFEDDLMMYAKTRAEIREWIHDGVPRRKAASATWRADRARGALKMPAFKRRLRERQIDDLVAYVVAMSGGPEPDDSLVSRGRQRVTDLGCDGCHGPGGRLARANPGSWKGCIPSWGGSDFAELVRDSVEFRQWVEHGVSRRFEQNPFASFFLHRAAVRMPAFEKHLDPGDVPALWAYVGWLRSEVARNDRRE
jgi:mono/diheme cytochrome c family protein